MSALTADIFQALAKTFAERLQEKLGEGPGKGFAIMVWDGKSLNHVTSSRAEFAEMIAVQLSNWARTHIADEDAEIARLREGLKPTTQETVQ